MRGSRGRAQAREGAGLGPSKPPRVPALETTLDVAEADVGVGVHMHHVVPPLPHGLAGRQAKQASGHRPSAPTSLCFIPTHACPPPLTVLATTAQHVRAPRTTCDSFHPALRLIHFDMISRAVGMLGMPYGDRHLILSPVALSPAALRPALAVRLQFIRRLEESAPTNIDEARGMPTEQVCRLVGSSRRIVGSRCSKT